MLLFWSSKGCLARQTLSPKMHSEKYEDKRQIIQQTNFTERHPRACAHACTINNTNIANTQTSQHANFQGRKSRNFFLNSKTPMGVHETSMKEHLTNFTVIRRGNKRNMEMHTTKRNKQKQQNHTHFRNKQETKQKQTNKQKTKQKQRKEAHKKNKNNIQNKT